MDKFRIAALLALALALGAAPGEALATQGDDGEEPAAAEVVVGSDATDEDAVVTEEADGGTEGSEEAAAETDDAADAVIGETAVESGQVTDGATDATGAVAEEKGEDVQEPDVVLEAQSERGTLTLGSWTSWRSIPCEYTAADTYKLVMPKSGKVRVTIQAKNVFDAECDIAEVGCGGSLFAYFHSTSVSADGTTAPGSGTDSSSQWVSAGTYELQVYDGTYEYLSDGAPHGSYRLKAELLPTWKGATSMPVGSTAAYTVTNGSMKVKSGGSCVSLKGNTLTAKKAGTATVALLDSAGKEYSTRQVKVYALSGSYVIQSLTNSNYVLDIRGKSKANSARMIVWPRNGGNNQKFQFVRQSDDTFAIKCSHSGKYLDVKGGGTAKSQPVIQYKWNGGKNQRWRIRVDADNCLTFVSAKSGMALDVQGGKAKKGARMIQYPVNGGNNQRWVLKRK